MLHTAHNYQFKEKKSLRDAFGQALVELGTENPNVVVINADLSESTRSHLFEKQFPKRFFQTGVAEQNMAGIAAGMASQGKIPFITSFSAFSPAGNWAVIRTSIAYSNANVKIVSTHSGFSDGRDGATHQSLEDVALMRVLPNLTVLSPCDFEETKKAVAEAAKIKGPVYIRLFRDATDVITREEDKFEIGKAQIFENGNKATVVACGPILSEVLKALDGKDFEIINSSTIKPLDVKTISSSARKTGVVITVEEHQISGGLGDAVAEALGPLGVKLFRIGVNDSFGESGSYEELLHKHKLDTEGITEQINKFLGGKNE